MHFIILWKDAATKKGGNEKIQVSIMDLSLVYELAKTVTGRFDIILTKPADFASFQSRELKGNVWADLTPLNAKNNQIQQNLRTILSKHKSNHYSEGMFLLKAEYGRDWFTPILQLPHVVLRQPSNIVTKDLPFKHETYVLFYLGDKVKEFCSAFFPIGLIPGINSWSFYY